MDIAEIVFKARPVRLGGGLHSSIYASFNILLILLGRVGSSETSEEGPKPKQEVSLPYNVTLNTEYNSVYLSELQRMSTECQTSNAYSRSVDCHSQLAISDARS